MDQPSTIVYNSKDEDNQNKQCHKGKRIDQNTNKKMKYKNCTLNVSKFEEDSIDPCITVNKKLREYHTCIYIWTCIKLIKI